jgi:Tfp pilus assembly protein FimT
MLSPLSKRLDRQRGFTLIELTVVGAIIMILSIVVVPNINGYLVENKVPRVGEEVQRFIARTKVSVQGLGSSPYGSVTTAQIANAVRGSSVFQVTGTGAAAAVTHDIGASGAAVTLTPTTLTSTGDSMQIQFASVSRAACPGLAVVMQKVSEVIRLNGTEVKASGGNYQPTVAENACTDGDTNQFQFVAR